MNTPGRDSHGKAESSREHGDFLEALQWTDQTLLEYQKENNVEGITDILASRSITLRHLFEKTGDRTFLIIARHEAMAGVEVARNGNHPSALVMPLLRLAQVQEELSEFGDALHSYTAAIETFEKNPPEAHNRPAVLLDMKIRATICAYKNGDTTGIPKVLSLLAELESSDEWKYNKDVWVSGGYMNLALLLKDSDPEAAKKHLEKAKTIIDGNNELILRKAQWEKLAKTISLQ